MSARNVESFGMDLHEIQGWNVGVTPDFDAAFAGLCCRDDKDNAEGFERINSSRLALVYRFEFGGQHFYFKENLYEVGQRVKALFRGRRAVRAIRGNQVLQEIGLNSPETVAIGFRAGRDFLVTREIPDARDLYCLEDLRAGELELSVNALGALLGREVGRMHAAKVRHGDLRHGNVMLSGKGDELKVFFIDNDRTQRCCCRFEAARLKNLVQLNISGCSQPLGARMRFWASYLREVGASHDQGRKWLEHVIPRTSERLAKIKAPRGPL